MKEKKARGELTPGRQRVLAVLLADPHRVWGAYEILERLEEPGKRSAPMTVYRALEYWIAEGRVHRIASLNGFVACAHGESSSCDRHPAHFLICQRCRSVTELDGRGITQALADAAGAVGFCPDGPVVIEVAGLCARCREEEAV